MYVGVSDDFASVVRSMWFNVLDSDETMFCSLKVILRVISLLLGDSIKMWNSFWNMSSTKMKLQLRRGELEDKSADQT